MDTKAQTVNPVQDSELAAIYGELLAAIGEGQRCDRELKAAADEAKRALPEFAAYEEAKLKVARIYKEYTTARGF